jgi:hypothetical protein
LGTQKPANMKLLRHLLLIAFVALAASVYGQTQIDSIKFFQDESVIDVTLEWDMKDLLQKKIKERFVPANITMQFADGKVITEKIQVSARGNFRRETCYMPGLKLNFHNPTSPQLYKLDELKMVCGCNTGGDNEQLILREYMIYKMFSLFTEKSLRVRLMKVTYKDIAGKRKTYTQYGFLIEDIDEMARRNGMKEVEGTMYKTELTDRAQMTMVSLFQYMIGNTDWSVPNYHNIKLIGSKEDPNARPVAVPYDFDICGFVDPPYATVDDQLTIDNVRDRLYRGFPRTMDELQAAIKLFNDRKESIYSLIQNFTLLESRSRKWAIAYLDDFYKTVNSPRVVQATFIEGARTQ